jgi:hypothetical protein
MVVMRSEIVCLGEVAGGSPKPGRWQSPRGIRQENLLQHVVKPNCRSASRTREYKVRFAEHHHSDGRWKSRSGALSPATAGLFSQGARRLLAERPPAIRLTCQTKS